MQITAHFDLEKEAAKLYEGLMRPPSEIVRTD